MQPDGWNPECLPTPGTLLHALSLYIYGCEQQDTISERFVLVVSLLCLNVVELCLLLRLGVQTVGGRAEAFCQRLSVAACSQLSNVREHLSRTRIAARWAVTSNQSAARQRLPIRVWASILLSWVLVGVIFARLYVIIAHLTDLIANLDSIYGRVASVFGDCDAKRKVFEGVCNIYAHDHPDLEPSDFWPRFHGLPADCAPSSTAVLNDVYSLLQTKGVLEEILQMISKCVQSANVQILVCVVHVCIA
jgi:hypothetical protein|eukprot:COSAG01_NODE_979_length_12356_cov_224.025618_12_plen_248_part_00